MESSSRRRLVRLSALAVLVATTLASPASARPRSVLHRAKDAKLTSTSSGSQGVLIDRQWLVEKSDPFALTAKIRVRNPGSTPVTLVHFEPVPTTAAERVVFTPKKLAIPVDGGVARVPLTVEAGKAVNIGYTARLAGPKRARAQDQLDAVTADLDNTLATAQPIAADATDVALAPSYSGTLTRTVDEQFGATGSSTIGRTFRISLILKPSVADCWTPGRGCTFTATDNVADDPKLTALQPSGPGLAASQTADISNQSGIAGSCADGARTATNSVTWTVEPTNVGLTWSGWRADEVQYTVKSTLDAPQVGRCVEAIWYRISTGPMKG